MGFTRLDKKLVRTEHLFFDDKGKVSKGSKTHKFAVISAVDHAFLGYVKWFGNWREYIFFPQTGQLRHCCLADISGFCQEVTAAQRQRRQAFPVVEVQASVAPAQEPLVEVVGVYNGIYEDDEVANDGPEVGPSLGTEAEGLEESLQGDSYVV